MSFPIHFCSSLEKASFTINLAGNLAFFGALSSTAGAICVTAFNILGIKSGLTLGTILIPLGAIMTVGAAIAITAAAIQKMIMGVTWTLRGSPLS